MKTEKIQLVLKTWHTPLLNRVQCFFYGEMIMKGKAYNAYSTMINFKKMHNSAREFCLFLI